MEKFISARWDGSNMVDYHQKVSYDPKAETYELWDEYGGTCIDEVEFLRLVRCVKKHTPDWMEGL